jgi:oligosaccharide repeat unit polymerase
MFYNSVSFNLFFVLYLLLPFLFWDGFGVFSLNIFAVATYILSSLSLAQLCVSKKIEAMSSSFWIFVYIFLVIAPVSQQYTGTYPWPGYYDDLDLMRSWFLVFSCCFSFFIIGFFRSKKFVDSFGYSFSDVRMRFFIVVATILTVVSIYSIGGIQSVFLSRNELTELFDGSTSKEMATQAMFRIPFFVISLYYLGKMLRSIGEKLFVRFFILFFVFLTFTLILNNPVSTPRFWFACIFITYALVVLSHFKLKVNRLYILSLLFLTIFIFPVADAFRNSLDVSVLDYFSETNISEGFVTSPNYDSFQQISNAIVFVENNGYSYGARTLSALLFWVPRSFFPSKYISSGEDLALFARYEITNLSAPLWAEMFLDFGFAGAIFCFGILGWFVSYFDKACSARPNVVVFFVAAYGIYFFARDTSGSHWLFGRNVGSFLCA